MVSAQVAWPLALDVFDQGALEFAPLALGWMEAKGRRTVRAYRDELLGPARAADGHLRAHARRMRASRDCAALVGADGVVLSVPPLTNGHETRCERDAGPALLVEASSDAGEGPRANRPSVRDVPTKLRNSRARSHRSRFG